ncbi:MAG: SCP2 sterol-binding domain-containing protein [Deltaproteobacteria bacterium]|nr:SCP2 sterol-binding domain-containing protein [Deltaproteobacteria bacterium]MBW1847315.1 SCP2 sterol-binding domain-containing protein [Deltaproteobacteria bacterium]MBW1983556.1 SCP2 sterol-binding domain-containing protein [Deltaproteobacteria bacterium]MBW2180553.1 SCP2 sterol-binding domain-containing protein [Deltaproteobacteria bacterium]MBW2363740.1 SCP2 sterol-binding domain-containing protein [Deltaproteobacteria bacterium]
MAVFESKEKMQTVLGGLFEKLLEDPIMGPKFIETNIIICFNISEPNAKLWVVPGDGDKGSILWGDQDMKPTVEMTLSGDTCHKFWLKHISMPIALAKGLIKAKGPMPKVLKLLPLLKPAYEAYPEHAKSHGLSIEKE